jgi:magnesium transporter
MPASDAAEVMEAIPVGLFSGLLRCLAPPTAASAMELMPAEKAADALSAARNDLAAGVLRTMETGKRSTIVKYLSPDARTAVGRLLRYADGTAGALMDPGVLSVSEGVSVCDALERVRRDPQRALYYLYVVDEAQRLVGVLNIRELMGSRPEQLLGSVAVRDVASVPARASWQSVLAHPAWKLVHTLPVIETDGRFLGVIRYESVRQLEERWAETRLEDHGARTASSLGELYGLGLRGLFDLAASAVLGSEESERRRT